MRIGSPITGYGSESRNRAARQRIPNRTWTDEDGVEHVEVIAFWIWLLIGFFFSFKKYTNSFAIIIQPYMLKTWYHQFISISCKKKAGNFFFLMLRLHIRWNVGKFLYSWTSWWRQSFCGNVQGQGRQAVEVYLLNCGNKITFSSTADSWVICACLKDVHKLGTSVLNCFPLSNFEVSVWPSRAGQKSWEFWDFLDLTCPH